MRPATPPPTRADATDLRAVALGLTGSIAVLAYILLRGPAWQEFAIVLAVLLPAGLVLYGGAARRRAAELRVQQGLTQQAFARSEVVNRDLEQRVAELVTLNELGVEVVGTLDRDDLLDRSLAAITRHLRFDRALILLVDEERGVLTGGRSVGGSPEMAARIAELELPIDLPDGLLSRIARADGPLLFRDVDQDPDPGNREIAGLLEVTSFLGTPLATKGRTVGVLAVDNRLTGRDVLPGDGPLLYTVGSLIAAGFDNARLYEEVEAQKAALERRVAERTAALVEATAVAEAASASKSTFLSSVSHELRTPLTSIVGFSKLISKRLADVVFPALPPSETDDPKLTRAVRQVSENLAIIVEEGDRLTALINDTLDLAKIEAGRMEFRSEPVDVGEVISRATGATAALLAVEEGPQLIVGVEPDLPTVNGDRDRLIQVVINLISNAVKFTPTGSITVSAEAIVGGIQVAVTDTGAGIPAEDQERVFEPFGQSKDTLSETARGTGLGLPICREIITAHGGRLWLESEVGAGSTFRFTLPMPAVEDPAAHDQARASRTASA